jgi:hypothetical protein
MMNQCKLRPIETASENPLKTQIGGNHYKTMKIQPVEYIHANKIGFFEGCAITYLSRWHIKGGIQDLEKAKHMIELLIELDKQHHEDKDKLYKGDNNG